MVAEIGLCTGRYIRSRMANILVTNYPVSDISYVIYARTLARFSSHLISFYLKTARMVLYSKQPAHLDAKLSLFVILESLPLLQGEAM